MDQEIKKLLFLSGILIFFMFSFFSVLDFLPRFFWGNDLPFELGMSRGEFEDEEFISRIEWENKKGVKNE